MNAMEWTGAASTVEDAVKKGLKKLDLSRDQVDVKVLGEKTSGLFSLFGFRRMEVKLVAKPGVRRREPEGRPKRDESDFRRGKFRGDDVRNRGERSGRDRDPRGREGRGDGGRGDSRAQNRRPDNARNGRPSESGRGDRNRPSPRDEQPRDDRSRDGGFRNDRGPRRDDRRPSDDRSRNDRSRQDRGPRDGAGREGRRGPSNENVQARGAGFRDSPRRDAPPRREETREPREVPSPDVLLTQWKALLGWDDLAWTPKNGESGDIILVLDKASGEKITAEGGNLLESLQNLINAVRSKSDRGAPRVFLEVEGQEVFGERRIIEEAHKAAAEVQRTGEPFRLPPMDSRDRRLVHQTLASHPGVETASEGDGPSRKVVVKPKVQG